MSRKMSSIVYTPPFLKIHIFLDHISDTIFMFNLDHQNINKLKKIIHLQINKILTIHIRCHCF
jgi:hypothetical protein